MLSTLVAISLSMTGLNLHALLLDELGFKQAIGILQCFPQDKRKGGGGDLAGTQGVKLYLGAW